MDGSLFVRCVVDLNGPARSLRVVLFTNLDDPAKPSYGAEAR
ncbi:MAG TPA: hypothetical protein VEI94_11940 [Candidatus Bathyarchaeia archaeon]|nr:hypothetical protein [Candidatus Bathyarchaeia archaeon]